MPRRGQFTSIDMMWGYGPLLRTTFILGGWKIRHAVVRCGSGAVVNASQNLQGTVPYLKSMGTRELKRVGNDVDFLLVKGG